MLSRDESRALDRRAIDLFGVPGVVLMENAGRGCAELLMRLNPDRKPTVILCGPGNNGGDGFVIARHLDNYGWPVRVIPIEPGDHPFDLHPQDSEPQNRRASPEFMTNWVTVLKTRLQVWPESRPTKQFETVRFPDEFQTRDCWIVDALFGTGLSRPLETPYAEVVKLVNASNRPVLAIDIPSGLDCDTGEPLGPCAKATHTATFVAPKRGFLNPNSKAWTGEVHVIDIGAPRVLVEEYRNRADAG